MARIHRWGDVNGAIVWRHNRKAENPWGNASRPRCSFNREIESPRRDNLPGDSTPERHRRTLRPGYCLAGCTPAEPASSSPSPVRIPLTAILLKLPDRQPLPAGGFAHAVKRYLHDEPVHACPPSTSYRFKKFARRNKGVLITVLLVAATLLAGAAVSTWQVMRTARAACHFDTAGSSRSTL